MPCISLTTEIKAPIERCFDLSRSIDLHVVSTSGTDEKAVGGRTSGLIEKNETVTWQAVHLGVKQNLTSLITEFEYPNFFVDEMISGAFKSFRHEHRFTEKGGVTIMDDKFTFKSPLGFIGEAFNALYLTNYITRFLLKRNAVIKEYAEVEGWKKLV
ncbi:MAG: hypothetical protein JWO06_103 [Bacteroidota bacterium]|nr:hypothetical protein [Bacteroidota bacterium]